jgi:hypothetical protein
VWASDLARQMPSAVLVTRDGDGHTSYLKKGRAQATIDRYLATRHVPPRNTVLTD